MNEENENVEVSVEENATSENSVEVVETIVEGNVEPVLDINFLEIKKLIHAHYVNVVTFLKYNKDKDANLNNLTKQMNMYREGLEVSMFRSLAVNIIGYREDCQKSLRDLDLREFGLDELKKYLTYLFMDFQDLLNDVGIEKSEEGAWYYNGKNPYEDISKIEVNETLPEVSYTPLPVMQVKSLDDIATYLQSSEELIQKTLQTNAVLDKTLGDYIKYCTLYEKGAYQVMLYPVIRRLIKMSFALEKECGALNEDATTEDYKAQYVKALRYVIEETESILLLCNVTIESEGLDKFEGKKHRMLKAIKTEDPTLNGVVANKYSDCYSMGDKVIYPSKVDVYRV